MLVPLHSIVYVSTAIAAFKEEQLLQLLHQARARNQAAGITGILLYSGERFLQVLEGPAEAVHKLYARIVADPRHSYFDKLADGPIYYREFADWHMSFRPLAPQLFNGLLGFLSPAQLLYAPPRATLQEMLREFLEADEPYVLP